MVVSSEDTAKKNESFKKKKKTWIFIVDIGQINKNTNAFLDFHIEHYTFLYIRNTVFLKCIILLFVFLSLVIY